MSKSMIDLSGQVRGYLLTQDESFARGDSSDNDHVKQVMESLQSKDLKPEEKAGLGVGARRTQEGPVRQ